MKMKSVLLSAIAVAIAVGIALPASARPAVLVGNQTGSRVNVRSAPSADSYSPHYGLVGDQVEVLNETRSNDGYIWCYVRFPQSGAEGWIRGDLVRYLYAANAGD